ncbi:potassium transporter TrkH [Defluviimonas sp. 20V17]|uniref:Potassium transporter TrkH n=1 Tax=Allgaiera indica TaxID=765699 RepID=A0AAN4URW2_9RHOB|nr:potassium transporter TrkG [Allgaiera indica]KDB01845.1 potassium transporter TrkH [Defluviimonas sp. 20V17]GHE02458.1 potassium transporter TrkH [Allgaiera indica]SDX29646.1 trk system potassium uptake protein TrkH [Allgaiera indica]
MGRLLDLPLLVILMGITALAMLLPAAHAFVLRDFFTSRAFFYSSILFLVLTAILGVATSNYTPRNAARSHLAALLGAYLVLPVMMAFPFAEAVPDTSFANSWFEMVSDFTTTGATLYAPDRLAPSVHLWRGLVGWGGGFFILLAALAVLAPLNLGGFEVLSGGAVGRGVGGQITRVADPSERLIRYTLVLFPAYGGLTLVLWIGLLIAGDPSLVALIHAMSTLSTSGISPVGGLAGARSGIPGEMLIFLFLIFAISRHSLPGVSQVEGRRDIRTDPEFRMGVTVVVVVTLLLFLRHWTAAYETRTPDHLIQALRALWASAFTALSFLSTTGFQAEGWDTAQTWSGLNAPGLILVGLALMGGGVATTAGGVKLLRIYALFKHGQREMEKLVHPNSIGGAGPMARRLRREGAYVAWIFFMLFGLAVILVMALLTLTGIAFEPALVFSVAALSTTGPLATVATEMPLSYAALGLDAKLILAGAMVLGRLETLAIIALLAPDSWRN